METGRTINRRIQHYTHDREYLLHIESSSESLQDENPIDLTSGSSGRHVYPQMTLQYHTRDNPNYLESPDNQAEILRAAKLLFSKKTRTLYHWMYPDTPKLQLKTAVTLAWDSMGIQEKQFYISQVLGKFGYLQSSLMVNPQLGCMSLPTIPHINLREPDLGNVETNNAVTNILPDASNSWQQLQPCPTISRKRGRPKGSKHLNSNKISRKMYKSSRAATEEDFGDDPELRQELEQFQWTLHLVEK